MKSKEVKMTKRKARRVVLLPDIHHPYHDENCLNAVYHFLKWFKPDELVLLGDAMDMTAASHWLEEKGKRKALENKRIKQEYEDFDREVLSKLEKVLPKWCVKVFMGGNHEDWAYQLVENDPRLEGMVEPEIVLDLANRGWKWIPYLVKDGSGGTSIGTYRVGKLLVFHGMYTNKYHAAKTVGMFSRSVAYGHCLDEETEILTEKGFKKLSEIKGTEKCLTLNKQTGFLQLKKINKLFVYNFSGKMVEIKSGLTDILVDPKHGMIWKNHPEGELVFGKAEELVEKRGAIILPISGFMPKTREVEISDNLLQLIAWVASEGSIRWIGSTPYVDIVQSKTKGIKRIEYLLDRLRFSHVLGKKDKSLISKLQPYRFRIHVEGSRKITSYLKNKGELPEWLFRLSNRQFELFLKEYTRGDGTTYRGKYKNQKMLYSNDKKWIDYFQIMLFKNGYKSTPYWRISEFGGKPCCQLNYQKKSFTELKSKNNVRLKEYSGKIWCINNDNGTIIIRRNGKMCITQNTHDLQTYVEAHVDDPRSYHTAQSIGCLCKKSPDYMKGLANRWINAFGIVYVREGGDYNLYTPIIIRGKFTFANKVFG